MGVFGRVAGKACAKYMLGDDLKETSLSELSGGGLSGSVEGSKLSGGSYEDGMNKSAGAVTKGAEKAGTVAATKGGYSMEEVAKHTTKTDCWVVLHNNVLNVTNFLASHPGGELAILTFAGKDATAEFDMIHPPDVISKYAPDAVIGVLGGGAPQQQDLEAGGSSGGGGKAMKAILDPPPHQPQNKDNMCMRCFRDTKWCFLKFDGVTWALFLTSIIF